MSRSGPWQPDQILPLVDFSGTSPWHGAPEPSPIQSAVNPGALVAVLAGRDGRERRRWLLTGVDPIAGVHEAAEACITQPGSHVVIYDGDTGLPVVSFGVAGR
jgi:hypothetical protein